MSARFLLFGAALALAACEIGAPPGLGSSLRPAARPAALPSADVYTPSLRSRELRSYYARLEQSQIARGLMRTDAGLVDAPFNARILADNFIQIALFDEHPGDKLGAGSRPTSTRLRKWQGPVRIGLEFGASVPEAARAVQVSQTRSYASRLAQVTGHPIGFTTSGSDNFTIFVVDEDERRALGPTLKSLVPGIGDRTVENIVGLPRNISCLVVAFSNQGTDVYRRAISIIRAEHPPASWRSCLHEEVAQGLGLPNDSPRARPSIFNDDEEFALLTGHDELLLSMLYSSRLRPGMTAREAEPIIRQLAVEKLGTGAS
ncbi:MAG: DUF2927 domain-containing protein [Pseudomonadota bacterium]